MRKLQIKAKDYYDLGLQLGKDIKPELTAMIDLAKRYMREDMNWSSFKTDLSLGAVRYGASLLRFKFNKNIREQIAGLAKGSGITEEWIYLMNFMYEFCSVFSSSFSFLGCSSFAFPAVDKDYVVIGKTTDLFQDESFITGFIKERVFVDYQIAKGNNVKTVIFPGQISSDFAIINDAIFIGFNDGGVNTKRNDFKNNTIVSILEDIYNNAESVNDALDRMGKERSIHPFVGIISDGTRENTSAFNLLPGGLKVFKMENAFAMTNFLTEIGDRDYYYEKDWSSNKYYLSAKYRHEALMRHSAEASLTLEEGQQLLSRHTADFDYFHGSVNNKAVVNAVVWDGKSKRFAMPEFDGSFPLLTSKVWHKNYY